MRATKTAPTSRQSTSRRLRVIREQAADMRSSWTETEREYRRNMALLMQAKLFECARPN